MSQPPKILLIGPKLILGWTESTARALEGLGCAVRTVFYNSSVLRTGIRGMRQWADRRWGFRLPEAPHYLQRLYGTWLTASRAKKLLSDARAFQPELILVLKGESLQAALLCDLKTATGAALAVWWVDHPFMNAETRQTWDRVPACIPLYDLCLIFDRAYEKPLREAGARAVRFLPCAADPDLYNPRTLTADEQNTYGASVSLIGVHSPGRERIVHAMSREDGLGVWGPGWGAYFASRSSNGGSPFRGEALAPVDACKVYNASPINLNTHHSQSQRAGLNTRAFEILAAGAFEMTDYVPEMDELLEPGRDVAVYHSPEEALERVRYFIKSAAERARVAEAGHRRVLGEHTYRHRMQTLLQAL